MYIATNAANSAPTIVAVEGCTVTLAASASNALQPRPAPIHGTMPAVGCRTWLRRRPTLYRPWRQSINANDHDPTARPHPPSPSACASPKRTSDSTLVGSPNAGPRYAAGVISTATRAGEGAAAAYCSANANRAMDRSRASQESALSPREQAELLLPSWSVSFERGSIGPPRVAICRTRHTHEAHDGSDGCVPDVLCARHGPIPCTVHSVALACAVPAIPMARCMRRFCASAYKRNARDDDIIGPEI
ncbi:hypothetical protein PYCCODRAFT_1425338 [Trametes coccinea BRFM310]|uniref:Uncharacterized protein n=1 Tax=Trametes coccinea (strain BRFM310) TaxID=1353009 RepID=A0A1Y2IN33_TRAC3|nr:hypothetical protein PYCCODRAFT_1425338 [Trametes coccinea BRFM310]